MDFAPAAARAARIACLTLIAALAGCADMTTINRTNPLPSPVLKVEEQTSRTEATLPDGKKVMVEQKTPKVVLDRSQLPATGKAIHLDAPQRLAFVNALGQVCAEPSPDALQAFAAAVGASIVAPGKSVEIAQALGASAGSIGLRTQSITLMRDHMYRICEAYYNQAMSQQDVVALLQRSQDLTLAVLAIEQLTGVVAARQLLLSPEARANLQRGMLDKSVEALENAKKTEADALAARDKAQAALDALPDSVKNPTTAADKKKLNDAQTASAAAQQDYVDAQAITAVRRAELENGKKAIEAATKVTGTFAEVAGGTNIDKDTVAQLADATRQIVDMALHKNYMIDSCMNLIAATANTGSAGKESTLTICKEVIETHAKAVKAKDDAAASQAAAAKAQAEEVARQIKQAPAGKSPAAPPAYRLMELPRLDR